MAAANAADPPPCSKSACTFAKAPFKKQTNDDQPTTLTTLTTAVPTRAGLIHRAHHV